MNTNDINLAIQEATGISGKDFTSDLNAMHEARKTLKLHQCRDYGLHLYWVMGSPKMEYDEKWTDIFLLVHATARQHAEAFLRCLGKWKEPQSVETPIATGE